MAAVVGVFIYEHRKLRALPATCPAGSRFMREGPRDRHDPMRRQASALSTNDPQADGQSLTGGRCPGLASSATRRRSPRILVHLLLRQGVQYKQAVYNVNCCPYLAIGRYTLRWREHNVEDDESLEAQDQSGRVPGADDARVVVMISGPDRTVSAR